MEPSEWMSDYFDKQKARSERLKESFKRNRGAIFDALKSENIASVELHYDGVGDSGCLDAPEYFGSNGKHIDAPQSDVAIEVIEIGCDTIIRKGMPLSEALESVAYDALEVFHPGWEINEGAYGIFRVEVQEGTMTLCNSLRSTDYTENEICGED